MAQSDTTINIAYPESGDLQLRLAVGACRLRMSPGSSDAWIAGTYSDPSRSLPIRIVQDGGNVRISHEADWANIFGWFSGVPTFDLALGKQKSFSLLLETGGSESDLQLGGVPLKRLEIKYGAGKMTISFSEPNPEPMTLFDLSS